MPMNRTFPCSRTSRRAGSVSWTTCSREPNSMSWHWIRSMWSTCRRRRLSSTLAVTRAAEKSNAGLRAGFAETDITPTVGANPVYMAGFGQNRKATRVHDSLKARAIVLQHAGRKLAIVAVDVVDTGLTMNFLCRTLQLRAPASLAIATLLDRPYRRLVDDLPVRYVGFTIPDEFFVGYGFELEERYRNLPDLRLVRDF